MVALRKPNKRNYKISKIWRSIVFLNTVGKLIEAAAAKRLYNAAEKYFLFSDFQMGVRFNRFTETAFKFFIKQIHTAWKIKKIATFLFLDLFNIFDRIFPIRIYQILRTRRISE
jgi:hypothetical protein